MKKILLFIGIILSLNSWSQSKQGVTLLEIFAYNFDEAYEVEPSKDDVRNYGIHLEIKDSTFVNNSRIMEYAEQLEEVSDMDENGIGNCRAILTIRQENYRTGILYISRQRIVSEYTIYKPHPQLVKAIYSLLPKSFWLEDNASAGGNEDEASRP